MTEAIKKARLAYRNIGLGDIARYRLPWIGKVSILHRASGTLMLLLLPFVLCLFEQSPTSEISFIKLMVSPSNSFAKVVVLVPIWAYLYYFCAGVCHLILDLHIGIDRTLVSKPTVGVLIVSLLLIIVLGAKLFGLL